MTAVDLNDYFYFVHVVEKGGFSAAAKALGLPKSRLSRHIAALEARMDTRLIQRTTRQFNITEIGEVLYQHARALIDEMENAEAAVKRKKDAPHAVYRWAAVRETLTGPRSGVFCRRYCRKND